MHQCKKQSIKQHDTLDILCRYTDDDGQPLSLFAITIKSQMRDALNKLIDTLRIVVTDVAAGEFVMSTTVDELPVGTHKIDVMFAHDNKRITSETFSVTVDRAVTER